MIPTSISFVLPMYNEKNGIRETARKLAAIAKELTGDYEIIISDDASTDGSGLVADEMARGDSHIKVVHLERNTKFGGALKAGIERAEKEIIIYTDSDLPIETGDIKNALGLLDESDIVTAYSKIKKGETMRRVIMSKVYNFLVQFLFATNIKDINSGFKIYKRKVFKEMKLISKSPFIDVEIFVNAKNKNFKIKQYPVIFKHRKMGESYISRPAVIMQTAIDMLKLKFKGVG